MRFFALSIKIIFALYIAKFTAQQVLSDNYYIVGVLFVGLVGIIYTSWKQRFYAFSIFVLLPFSFPSGFSLPFVYWSDFFAIVFFGWFFIEILIKKEELFSVKSSLFLSAIAVITLWSIINYIFNPVGGSSFLGASAQGGGIRAYLVIISGICTFFVGFWFFKYERIDAGKCLFVLLIVALVIGNLKIAGYSIPLLGKSYAHRGFIIDEGEFLRMGGLRNLSIIGFPVFFSYFFRKKWNLYTFLIMLNLVVFCVLGAGRAIFAGIILATILYYALINRKHLLPVIAIIIMISTIYVIFLSNVDLSKTQYSRIIAIEGGLKKQNDLRYYSYLFMWDIFKDSPVFGKGVGYKSISRESVFFIDYPEALKFFEALERHTIQGSHGAYMSILSIFGIGGIYFIIVMLFGGMYYAYRIAIKNNSSEEVYMAVFVFMYLAIMSVHMYTAGTGYNYRDIWFLPGVIAGLLARNETEKINNEAADGLLS